MKRPHFIGAIDIAACVALIAVVWLLYGKVLRLWWTYDDAYLIHIAVARRWIEYFSNGEVWRSMPQRLFTPLLTSSYDTELSMFGLNARAWYVMQLVVLSIAAIAVYAAFRLWFIPLLSFAGVLLFVAGAPVCSIVTELMLIHYLESLALAALAAVAFVRGIRTSRRTWVLASAALYLAAMLAKEIAVPLLLLLYLLPEGDVRTRLRAVVPHVVILVFYAFWRWTMLKTLFGGYGWAVESVWALVLSLPMKMAVAFGGAPVAILLIGAIAALRSRRAALLVIVGLLLAAAPIAPIAAHMERRFAVAPWLWLCSSFVAGCAVLRPRVAQVLMVTAVAVMIVVNRQAWRSEFASSFRMSEEGRTFFSLGPNALLRHPLIPPAAVAELKWLKEDYQLRLHGTGWFYDDLFLCDGAATGKRVWQYEAGSVIEITDRITEITRGYCSAIRANVPLSAEFHHRGDALFWRFGPYREGSWRVVIADGLQAFDVPASDGFRLGELPGIALRVRYQSPERWVTYSPEIELDFVHHPDYRWQR